jgi:predicted small lipoprotein YifL
MKNARFAPVLLALALACLLAACGNKGDLVHPDPAQDAKSQQ